LTKGENEIRARGKALARRWLSEPALRFAGWIGQ
jgi:hypothetical protein